MYTPFPFGGRDNVLSEITYSGVDSSHAHLQPQPSFLSSAAPSTTESHQSPLAVRCSPLHPSASPSRYDYHASSLAELELESSITVKQAQSSLENVLCEKNGKLYAKSLLNACRDGVLDKVKSLIENNAVDIESKDGFNQTPLSVACEKGHLEVVKFLVKHNADIESKDFLNRTPLRLACEEGHLKVVKLLVECNADIENKDKQGMTPLSWACREGHLEVVKFLAEHSADIDSKDRYDKTPLQNARSLRWRYLSVPIMQLLIEHNAKVDRLASNEARHNSILRKALHQSGSVKFKVVKVMLTG